MRHVDSLFLDTCVLKDSWLVTYYTQLNSGVKSTGGSWFKFQYPHKQDRGYWFVCNKSLDGRITSTFTNLVKIWSQRCTT